MCILRHIPYHTIFFVVLCAMLLAACNITKFVPDDQALLYKTKVVMDGPSDVQVSTLRSYLRQTQNTEVLGFWKLKLHLYNTAPLDTLTPSQKRRTANAHKVGEPPVVYDPDKTAISLLHLERAMANEGYFHAHADSTTIVKDRKVWLTYTITPNLPYTIRNYNVDLDTGLLYNIATDVPRRRIKPDERFSAQTMDEERERITRRLRRRGYYFFDKEMLHFRADSTIGNRQVDVTLHLSDYVLQLSDSVRHAYFSPYRIGQVIYHSELPLRESILRRQTLIRSGELYNERLVTETYANLSALGPVRYSDIQFTPIDTGWLDCHIYLTKAKQHSIEAEIGGTYSNDDWGINGRVSYTNRNLFHGAEQLRLAASASYEWRSDGGRAIEARAEAALSFVSHWRLDLLYAYQKRPDEYTRNVFSASVGYDLSSNRGRWNHRFNVLDISYIYLPYISSRFETEILSKSTLLRYSYQDHFIIGWNVLGIYSNKRTIANQFALINFRYQAETAGNLMYALSRTIPAWTPNANGIYELIRVPYAQFAKLDVNFSYNQRLADNHRLVFHIGTGIAVPYLNSKTVPFEKRFYSGGANSVRGWQARTLGPGAFRGSGLSTYDLQVGDIRLDLNLEYRWRVWNFIELAAFVDAGNNWTISDYPAQPYGVFDWKTAGQQLALSYGVGVRFDVSILILRLDLGVKLHDPTRQYGSLAGTQWRTVANGLGKDDFTLHFAIGYPF